MSSIAHPPHHMGAAFATPLKTSIGMPNAWLLKSLQQQYVKQPAGQQTSPATSAPKNPSVGPTTLQRQGLLVPTCTHINISAQ